MSDRYEQKHHRKKIRYDELMEKLEHAEDGQAQIRKEMEKLIRIRKSCDAFDTHAEQKVLQEEKELFSYIRNGKTKRVLCLHNFFGEGDRKERHQRNGFVDRRKSEWRCEDFTLWI